MRFFYITGVTLWGYLVRHAVKTTQNCTKKIQEKWKWKLRQTLHLRLLYTSLRLFFFSLYFAQFCVLSLYHSCPNSAPISNSKCAIFLTPTTSEVITRHYKT